MSKNDSLAREGIEGVNQNGKMVLVPIGNIKPYGKNPRKHGAAIDLVAASIKAYGFLQPIVCDMQGVIIVGHTRLKAAQMLGLAEVPVIYADLDEIQAKKYRLADNKTHEHSSWDNDKLISEVLDLIEAGQDVYADELAFTQEELDRILQAEGREVEQDNIFEGVRMGVQVEPEDDYIVIVAKKGMNEAHDAIRQILKMGTVKRGGYPPGKINYIIERQRVISSQEANEAINAACRRTVEE